MQAVYAVSKLFRLALCYRDTGCLSYVGTYQPGTVQLQGWQAVKAVKTYLLGTELQRCSLFKGCRNLPAGHCLAGVQAVKALCEPIWWALCCCLQAV